MGQRVFGYGQSAITCEQIRIREADLSVLYNSPDAVHLDYGVAKQAVFLIVWQLLQKHFGQ
jgi:hypothetical protein